MIEEILSPDLRRERRQEEAKVHRLKAASRFKIGDTVKAGENGEPGRLESISDEGFAAIRWPGGSLLCGVAATDLMNA